MYSKTYHQKYILFYHSFIFAAKAQGWLIKFKLQNEVTFSTFTIFFSILVFFTMTVPLSYDVTIFCIPYFMGYFILRNLTHATDHDLAGFTRW